MGKNMQRENRIRTAAIADTINRIEGAPVSDYAKHLTQRWIDGELTHEQRHAALLARYQAKS